MDSSQMFQQKVPKKKVNLFLQISAEVKHLFKAWCARHNITMTKAVEEMMKEKIKKG